MNPMSRSCDLPGEVKSRHLLLLSSSHIIELNYSCWFPPYSIIRIWLLLFTVATQVQVQSLVISGPDRCNSHMTDLPSACHWTYANDPEYSWMLHILQPFQVSNPHCLILPSSRSKTLMIARHYIKSLHCPCT